jgi:transcriptional regulator with XRE-family HTH domain
METAGLTQPELAEAVNARLRAQGQRATVTDRTVRYWLTGKTRWPQAAIRAALAAEFDCPIEQLGFARAAWARPVPAEDDTVERRAFLAATTATAFPLLAAKRRIGSSDIERLYGRFTEIIASDHRQGGSEKIETQALAMAGQALSLQDRGTASQRVRAEMYGCAAAFTSSAMWAAVDGRRFNAAQQHFDRASSLATMSGDPTIQFRIWSHAGSMYRHLGRPGDALAANDVARELPVTRNDPLFASLGHARHAAILGLTGDAAAVGRALGHAQQAYERADSNEPRPVWLTAFFDQAELDGLATTAYLGLHNYSLAEAHAHRSLALLRNHLNRSHAITTARLAQAQLGQGDLEPAVDNAASLLIDGAAVQHPRVVGMLEAFTSKLHRLAPGADVTCEWEARFRDTDPGRTT